MSIPFCPANGDGSFARRAAYATDPNGLTGPVAVDVNNDGKPDLVMPITFNNAASVLLGNGNGTFQFYTDYATLAGCNPVALAAADFNHDSYPDRFQF